MYSRSSGRRPSQEYYADFDRPPKAAKGNMRRARGYRDLDAGFDYPRRGRYADAFTVAGLVQQLDKVVCERESAHRRAERLREERNQLMAEAIDEVKEMEAERRRMQQQHRLEVERLQERLDKAGTRRSPLHDYESDDGMLESDLDYEYGYARRYPRWAPPVRRRPAWAMSMDDAGLADRLRTTRFFSMMDGR